MVAWFIIAGLIALLMAYSEGQLRRLPISSSVIYLFIGYVLGPQVLGILDIDPRRSSPLVEGIAEIIIVISIFGSALKMRLDIRDRGWLPPLSLAFLTLSATVLGAAAVGYYFLHLPFGVAFLLGALLSPTDPVLASDVQVERPYDLDRVRFALSGEAGMNDGSAFPLVMLGLALIRVEPIESMGRWIAVNVLWGFGGAVVIGAVIGTLGGMYMLHLRLHRQQRIGSDNFLAIGIMGLSYGLTQAAQSLGFVAVFAAGVALRRIEMRQYKQPPDTIQLHIGQTFAEQEAATDPDKAALFMIIRLEAFTTSFERIGEAVVVILLGALTTPAMLTGPALIFAPLLFLLVRPASVYLGLARSNMRWVEKNLIAWFGIRGMASVFYLAYMLEHGAPFKLVDELARIALGTIAYSILAHGITVTPLMFWYERWRDRAPTPQSGT